MTNRQYQKLFTIFTFIKCGESNVKMFDTVCNKGENIVDLGRKFSDYTEQENNEFLKQWKKENDIKLTQWKVIGETGMRKLEQDKNGTPILIKKVR